VSSIALFELWHGVAKSSRREFNKKRLETFLAGPVHLLPFEDVDAERAGAIRADLESVGKPMGAYDLLIAGQAKRNKLTLISANLSEFVRIKALAWADWGKL
jgi:tRNA(fMet)-specific endonuclease VapC